MAGKFKCTMIVPLHDNDRKLFEGWKLEEIEREIAKIAGGCTAYHDCEGRWVDDEGMTVIDAVQPIVTVVDDAETVERLRLYAAEVARDLRQECVYFEVVKSDVDFVKPAGQDGMTIGEATEKAEEVATRPSLYYRIVKEVERDNGCPGAVEYGGLLPGNVFGMLVDNGYFVEVYKHKGTVATVVTKK
jgi:hypothetical protein